MTNNDPQHDQGDDDEPIIKDPIYDVMDDDEAQEAFDRLMDLAEEKETEDNKED